MAHLGSGLTVVNALPQFLDCLGRWKKIPTIEQFSAEYAQPLDVWLAPMLDDFSGRRPEGLYGALKGLRWDEYRKRTLGLDPKKEHDRVSKHIRDVESLLGVSLKGQVILFGAFTAMDGYARFDQGNHRVFLGVDESFSARSYLDILETHELTHVARESQAEVWTGFGLSPSMTHDAFTESQPVVEHLMSEGFSCVISELLNPGESPWHYVYQNEAGYRRICEHGPALDARIRAELDAADGNYGRLYDISSYGVAGLPMYAHYMWAWKWVKHLLRDVAGGDPQKLLGRCSKDWIDDARTFRVADC